MSSHGYKNVVFPPSKLVTPSRGGTQCSGTEARWTRTTRAGVILSSPSNTVDTSIITKTYDCSSIIYLSRYEFKATFPRRYEGRPIIHYHYKVSWERAIKSKNFSLCRWLFPPEKVTAKGREFITQAYFKGGVSMAKFSREWQSSWIFTTNSFILIRSLQVTRTMSREEKANSQR